MSPMIHKVIMHFGEMGSRWGISRTVGQMYALILLHGQPLCADQIAELLSISRSNVSMALKELQSWRLVTASRISGERKEYFSAPEDIWQIVRTLLEERRKREVEPTLSVLREVLIEDSAESDNAYALNKIRQMHDVIDLFVRWSDDMQKMDTASIHKLLRLGKGVVKVFELKRKLLAQPNHNTE